MTSDKRLVSERFPRSSQYHPEWVIASASGGGQCAVADRVAHHGAGLAARHAGAGPRLRRASSSIFLRREFGVQVWATDLWFSASENIQRVRDAGVEDGVFPIHADARSLPFAADFFDAIVCIDSFLLRDGRPVPELPRSVREAGRSGGNCRAGTGAGNRRPGSRASSRVVDPGRDLLGLHSAAWWRRHWERTGIMDVELADTMPDGWQLWLDWHQARRP